MTGGNSSFRQGSTIANANTHGWTFWITGLAGAGKTTIGRSFFSILARQYPHSVFLDGEELRRVVMPEAGYSLADRLECARRYGLLCQLLTEQGLNVVIATISMFEACRSWNRNNLRHYFEVYLRASPEVLRARDQNGLYSSGTGNGMVVGRDLPWECPSNSDVVIDNDGLATPEDIAEGLWREVSGRLLEDRA